jgi:hypothetical protein
MTMTHHEELEYERKLEDIIVRLSDLMLDIMLMSIKKINKQHQSLAELLEPKQTNGITF